jgi:hypothetical protein
VPEYSTTGKNTALAAIAAVADFASLHTGHPGNTGANELAGGTPAYARKAVTWNAPAGGILTLSNSPQFDVPAATVSRVGFWDEAVGGNFYGWAPLQGATADDMVPFTAAISDTLTAPAHGYVNGDQVLVIPTAGSLPTGLTEGTIYFVIGATTDTLQLSLTSGGAAVDITATGAGMLHRVVPQLYASQGIYTVNAAALTIL